MNRYVWKDSTYFHRQYAHLRTQNKYVHTPNIYQDFIMTYLSQNLHKLWLHLENSNGTPRLGSVSLLKNVLKRSTILINQTQAQIYENNMILSSAWVEWRYIILSWSFVRVDVLILLFLYTSLNNGSFSI